MTPSRDSAVPLTEQLRQGFEAFLEGSLSEEEFLQRMESRTLAKTATEDEMVALASWLAQTAAGHGVRALPLAAACERQSNLLNDLGRADAALTLSRAALPIIEQHAPPEQLAAALDHLACVHRNLGNLPEAIAASDRAVALYLHLMEKEGRRDCAGDLAIAWGNKGLILAEQGLLAAAVIAESRAIAILEPLVQQPGHPAVAQHLATAFNNLGLVLLNQRKLPEAAAIQDRAIALFRGLMEHGGQDVVGSLTMVLVNKGSTLWSQGALGTALAPLNQAIDLCEPLVKQERRELAGVLALALNNKGIVLVGQGHFAEALGFLDRARDLFEPLVYQEDRRDLRKDLAMVQMHRGLALFSQGELPRSLLAFDAAIVLYQQLVELEGRRELANGYAMACMNKGVTLYNLGKWTESVAAHDRAVSLYERLVEQDRRPELEGDLAGVLLNRVNPLLGQWKLAEAAASHDRGFAILERLVEKEGRRDRAPMFAQCLIARGVTRASQRSMAAALEDFDRAARILETLVEQEDRRDLAPELALALIDKGNALGATGKLDEAIGVFDRAIAIRRQLIEQEGRLDLIPALTGALFNKGRALFDQGKVPEAARIVLALDPTHFRSDDRIRYHMIASLLLWQLDQYEQALRQLEQGRRMLRQARWAAGIDETALEFVERWESVADLGFSLALQMNRPSAAFAAVQDGKATLFGDLRSRLTLPGNEPPEVLDARRDLVAVLSAPPEPARPGQRLAPEVHAAWQTTLHARTERYLRTWRLNRNPLLGSGIGDRPTDEAIASLEEIQASLAADRRWAILDFWAVNDEEITVFVVTHDDLDVRRLPFPSGSRRFQNQMADFHRATRNPLTSRPRDDLLNELDLYLFQPLRPLLKEHGIDSLYLVPHGFLHALPLHAARRGSSDYLCDEFALVYLPSSALLPTLPALDLAGPVFSLANPERGTPHSLPLAEREGRLLRQAHGHRGGHFHRGPEATWQATDHWGDAAVVHFSGHGYGHSSFAPLSHLRLAKDLLLAHDVVYRRPALRGGALVVLNGCQTAIRDGRAYNESLGLMTAFLLRKAALVLATQWNVQDGCAAEVVLAFLEEILNKHAAAPAALKTARDKVRRLHIDDLLHGLRSRGLADSEGEECVETGKLLAVQALLAFRAGRVTEARHFAEQGADSLSRAGLESEAEDLLALTRDNTGSRAGGTTGPRSFDHPLFWGAFQLVGRVSARGRPGQETDRAV